jgi:hypothetical protein
MTTDQPNSIRLQIADVLDTWAGEAGWNDELWNQFNSLMKLSPIDALLAHADEELIHYSGEFNKRNIFFIPVKPDKDQVTGYKEEFRLIAGALRNGTSWEEYKKQNRIFEGSELKEAIVRWFKRRFSR